MVHRFLGLILALVTTMAAGPLLAAPQINTSVQVNTQNAGNPANSRINLRAEGVISQGVAPVKLVPGSVTLLRGTTPVPGTPVTIDGDLCVLINDPQGSFPYNLEFRVTEFRNATEFPATITLTQGTQQTYASCKDRAAPVQVLSGPYTNTGGTENQQLTIPHSALLGAVEDPNGDIMTIVSAQNPMGGTIDPTASTVIFTPTPGAFGTMGFSFDYTVQDTDGDRAVFTANLGFAAVNDPPTAVASSCTVGAQGGACALDIADPDGDTNDLSFNLLTPPGNGTVDVASFNGESRTVIYTPSGSSPTDTFTYTVTDGGEPNQTSQSATVTITITQVPQPPTARIVLRDASGESTLTPPDIADTDGEPSETIIIDAGSSTPGVPPDSIVEWQFSIDGGEAISSESPQLSTTLTDGQHTLSVRVVDAGARASGLASVTVNVLGPANQPPAANNVVININGSVVATEIFVDNADFEPGEQVSLDASGSTDPDGGPLTFQWALIQGTTPNIISTAATANVRLPDGSNKLRLTITDSEDAQAFREVTVNVQSDPNLAGITGLSPNQAQIARAIDELCPRMNELDSEELTTDQANLLTRCNNLIAADGAAAQQAAALEAWTGEELTTAQRTGINISNLNLGNVGARLSALRGGATGISVAGLSITGDGTRLPLQELGRLAKDLLGSSGGSGGEEEGGGLLDRKLGLFINGRIGFGEKDRTTNESGYDIDTYGLTMGADYRFSDRFVAGLAAGWGSSKSEFDNDGGSLKSDGYSLSVYGTLYASRFYLDGIFTYGSLEHNSKRRVSYTLPTEPNPIDLTAAGKADGTNTSGGISAGYNFGAKGWTFGPTFAITWVDVDVDGFSETGAAGLNLEFGEQTAKSMQFQTGAQVAYALSRDWGVLSPQARVAYIQENEDNADAILVRFVNDPFVSDLSQASTTTFLVNTDSPDSEFLQWGVGLSALFKNGISGFINYEAFSSLEATKYGELTLGIRFERSW